MVVALSLNLWWGKAGGLMIGAMLGGWPGCWLGLLLGHAFDERLRLEPFSPRAWRDCRLPPADCHLLAATFALMGSVARLGRSDPSAVVVQFMDELDLDSAQREHAHRFFQLGAAPDLPVRGLLRWLSRGGPEQQDRREWLMRGLWRVATADGSPAVAQQRHLHRLAWRLGVDTERLGWQWDRGEKPAAGDERRTRSLFERGLEEAFGLLGIDPTAPAAEIKRAYRRAVARHHPDRLQAQGASDSEIREATQLTREIRLAYDDIRSARGF